MKYINGHNTPAGMKAQSFLPVKINSYWMSVAHEGRRKGNPWG
jgi:hypothetical protein